MDFFVLSIAGGSDWFSNGQQVIVVRLGGDNVSLAHLAHQVRWDNAIVFCVEGGWCQRY